MGRPPGAARAGRAEVVDGIAGRGAAREDHTAATWMRQGTGDARLVAEYLGHADLSTVSRYAHVASEEMHQAVQSLTDGLLALGPAGLPENPPRMLRERTRGLPGQDRGARAGYGP
jgi:Phage integrase family